MGAGELGTGDESPEKREPEGTKNLWLTACEAGADCRPLL